MATQDFAFAPGPEIVKKKRTQASRLRRYFQRRLGQSQLIDDQRVGSVRELIAAIQAKVNPPANLLGNMFLGAHSNEKGKVAMKMYRGQTPEDNDRDILTTFETLERTLADTSKSITIPDSLIGHADGDPTNNFVHFKGCNLGRDVPGAINEDDKHPFMLKWVAAFGHVKITAPRHYHGLFEMDQRLDSEFGTWEYMAYEFIVRSPTYLTRDALISAFKAAKYAFIPSTKGGTDAAPVPDDNWAAWIPAHAGLIKSDLSSKPLNFDMGSTGEAGTTMPFSLELTVDKPAISTFPWNIRNPGPLPSKSDPQFQTKMIAIMSASMAIDSDRPFTDDPSRYDIGHPFPEFRRMGYATFDEFISGHTWKFPVPIKGNLLKCSGFRAVYTLIVPVTDPNPGPDPSTSKLIFNFYPNPSTPPKNPTINITEDDDRFFATVGS